MLKTATPEEVGISSAHVQALLASLVKHGIHLHSLLLMRGDRIFLDAYWKPFSADRPHRMYSVTKSFVSVAVGLAEEDGLIDLDAPIASYFPEKIDSPLPPPLQQQTVRQMLTMTTVGKPKTSWFRAGDPDRTHLYFSDRQEPLRPAGTAWDYDSAGSQVLCALVEKVTGQSLFNYLNQRIFRNLNAFERAQVLKTPNGDSWGDSAMICTPRDMATFARFVMNYGTWKGERLMNEAYLRAATGKRVHNATKLHDLPHYHGYGYQFWMVEGGGFAFVGMGDQLTVCMPEQDLIMV
ncbi:MAG: serine hydrolase, partial [Clostridia bacterium]|nr:serine hydrolase [Clostridia bacterium]